MLVPIRLSLQQKIQYAIHHLLYTNLSGASLTPDSSRENPSKDPLGKKVPASSRQTPRAENRILPRNRSAHQKQALPLGNTFFAEWKKSSSQTHCLKDPAMNSTSCFESINVKPTPIQNHTQRLVWQRHPAKKCRRRKHLRRQWQGCSKKIS